MTGGARDAGGPSVADDTSGGEGSTGAVSVLAGGSTRSPDVGAATRWLGDAGVFCGWVGWLQPIWISQKLAGTDESVAAAR